MAESVSSAGSSHDGGGLVNCTEDALVRAAAAKVVLHLLQNLLFGRVRVAEEEPEGIEDHARRAIAALKRPLLDERLLERMEFFSVSQALDGGDFLSCDFGERDLTGMDRFLPEQYGARATQANPAAILAAGQPEVGAQDPQQWPVH